MRIPSWEWLKGRLEQDEALDKLEDAVEARDAALKELCRAESELANLTFQRIHRN